MVAPSIRIASLLPFPLANPGGVSTYVDGLSTATALAGCAQTCLIAPEYFLGGPGDRVSQVALVARQLKELRRVHPHVVHTHEHPALLAAALMYRSIAQRPVRVVHTIHVEPAEPSQWWKRRVLGAMLARCSAVTTVSEHTAAQVWRIADPVPKRIHVIYGGAEIKVRRPDDSAVASFQLLHGLGEDGPILCQISPLNFERKVEGICRLIEALPHIRESFPRARLLVVGDGTYRSRIESTRDRLGLGDAVILTGFLSDVSVPLALADVYCQMTLQDACPLSLLEAMSSGNPVVAARAGGIPELVSDGIDGVLVDPEPRAISAAVQDLLSDPARASRLGSQAALTARRRFTWRRVAAEFAPLYGLG